DVKDEVTRHQHQHHDEGNATGDLAVHRRDLKPGWLPTVVRHRGDSRDGLRRDAASARGHVDLVDACALACTREEHRSLVGADPGIAVMLAIRTDALDPRSV